jgi:hypothetical protein
LIQEWASVLPVVAPAVGALTGGSMKAIELYSHRLRNGNTPSPEEQHLADLLQKAQAADREHPSVGAKSKVEDLRHSLEVARLEQQSPLRGVLHGARKGLGYGAIGASLAFVPALALHNALSKRGSAKSTYIKELIQDAMESDLPKSWARHIGHGALVGGGIGALTGGVAGAATADPGDRLRRGSIGAVGGAVSGAGAGAAARGLDWRKAQKGLNQARSILKKELVRGPEGGWVLSDAGQEAISHVDIDPIAHTRTVIAPLGIGMGAAAGLTSPRGHKEKK